MPPTSIYWSDRNRNPPPPDAQFHWRTFSPTSSLPFSPSTQLLSSLPSPTTCKIVSSRYLPGKKGWIERVEQALKSGIQKVVLARCHILELASAPNPFALTASLQTKQEGAYLFCLANKENAFFGATPERLFRKEKNILETEALAGTLPKDLPSSLFGAKEEREWVTVQTFLQETLAPFSLSPPLLNPKTIHKTHNLQHLYSKVRATLRKEITPTLLLDALHPTPALCGTPKKKAFQLIQTLEPFDRGLYGGTIGWSNKHTSEWIVAIRSCFLSGKIAYLYTGAGIVEGSDPEKEWEELNQKEMLYKEMFRE
ncbi:MAG TPA: isochorismate synthase [Chlamydiales bacterium]|nr:isochorismate synthase [Chlamydiales bacterium]